MQFKYVPECYQLLPPLDTQTRAFPPQCTNSVRYRRRHRATQRTQRNRNCFLLCDNFIALRHNPDDAVGSDPFEACTKHQMPPSKMVQTIPETFGNKSSEFMCNCNVKSLTPDIQHPHTAIDRLKVSCWVVDWPGREERIFRSATEFRFPVCQFSHPHSIASKRCCLCLLLVYRFLCNSGAVLRESSLSYTFTPTCPRYAHSVCAASLCLTRSCATKSVVPVISNPAVKMT